MKRFLLTVALAVLALGWAAPAQAATNFDNAPNGAHYANGSSEPVCALSGNMVSCTGTQIAGVGNTNATVDLSVTTTFTGQCQNPGSKRKVVEPFTRSETDSSSTVITSTKNGRLVVPEQSAGTTTGEFEQNFTCPNPNWTPTVTGTATSFTYTLTFAGFSGPVISISG